MNNRLSIAIFALILLFCSFAQGQGSALAGVPVAVNQNGVPIGSTLVTVCTTNPGTGTCPTKSSLYTDATLTTQCTGTSAFLNNLAAPSVGSGCSNPGFTDSLGNVVAFSTTAMNWCQYSAATISTYSQPCPSTGGMPTPGGNNTFTGNNTFLGGQNSIAAFGVNGTIVVDGCLAGVTSPKYACTQTGLQSALNAAASTLGGWVIVPPGASLSLTTSNTCNGSANCMIFVGNTSAGTSAHLFVSPGAVITANISSSTTDVFQLGSYSTLECGLGAHGANGTINGVSQASTTVRTVVAADQQNGNVEAIYVKGCQFSNLTVSRALIDASATFANARIEDNILFGFTGSATAPGILISAGTGATGGIGPILVENNWVNPASNTAGIYITGVDPNSLGSAPILKVTLLHNQLEHTGTASMLILGGNASNLPQGIIGVGNWFLPSSTIGNNYKIVDVVGCQQCTFSGTIFSPVGATANPVYGFYLENTIANGVIDFRNLSPAMNSFAISNFYSTFDNFDSNPRNVVGIGDFVQLSALQGNRQFLQISDTGTGIEISSSPAWFGGNAKVNLWGGFGLSNPGQTTGYNVGVNTNPAANRTINLNDPGTNASWPLVVANGTVSVTPGNTAGTCTDQTATATGATTSMRVAVSPTSPQSGTVWAGYVSASNTVDVRVCTITALTGSATTFNWEVLTN